MKKAILMIICICMMNSCGSFSAFAEGETWETAYINLIHQERANLNQLGEGEQEISSYALYDIDKDGIPELFLRYGTSTASSKYDIYTFLYGTAQYLDSASCGSAELYSYPERNGALIAYAHMNHAKTRKLTLDNGILSIADYYEEFIPRENGVWYRAVEDYSPGASRVTEFEAFTVYPIRTYRIWCDGIQRANGSSYPNNDPSFFENVVNSNSSVVEVVTSRYTNIVGVGTIRTIGFSDLLTELTVVEDRDGTQDYGDFYAYYVDVNQDGQLEYVIAHERRNNDYSSNTFFIVLSEQNGAVYAYTDEHFGVTSVDQFGVFYIYQNDYGFVTENAMMMLFNGEDCFIISVPLTKYAGERK